MPKSLRPSVHNHEGGIFIWRPFGSKLEARHRHPSPRKLLVLMISKHLRELDQPGTPFNPHLGSNPKSLASLSSWMVIADQSIGRSCLGAEGKQEICKHSLTPTTNNP